MFNITKEGIVSLSRGDTASAPLFINGGTNIIPIRFKLQKNNVVYLGICEPGQPFENAILKKVYTPEDWKLNKWGDLVITLNPEDTELLAPGLYYYTIKLLTIRRSDDSENVQTVIKKTKFFVED